MTKTCTAPLYGWSRRIRRGSKVKVTSRPGLCYRDREVRGIGFDVKLYGTKV
jgi:hypothetical protein